jgi:hypothetical protein
LIEDEDFRRSPRVEKPGQLSARIPNDRKRVSVLLRVHADLVSGLQPVTVYGYEQDPFRLVLLDQIAKQVVVVIRVRTERGPKYRDDRAMTALRLAQRKRVALDSRCGEAWSGVSDLECGRAGGEQEREKRGVGELADEPYSVEASTDADFLAKLRITRCGEKPQFIPKASPGWVAWMLLPHTVDWYDANTSTVPVRA